MGKEKNYNTRWKTNKNKTKQRKAKEDETIRNKRRQKTRLIANIKATGLLWSG